jgi:sporulation protein YlmC with PRC-barrel domain
LEVSARQCHEKLFSSHFSELFHERRCDDVHGTKTRFKPRCAENTQQERIFLQEGFRASKIIDQPVKNAQGEELGEVDDLIMTRNGKIKKVILSVGGFLGIGDRLVAVPFKSLKIDERDNIVYNVTKQQLENHPVFSYRREGLYGYYYQPFYPLPAYLISMGSFTRSCRISISRILRSAFFRVENLS